MYLLYGHGGSYNHGAEAIVKMTIQALREEFPTAHIGLSCHFPEQDREFGIDADDIYGPDIEAWEKEKRAPQADKEHWARLMYLDALESITPDTTLYSVGGDNFCYPNWHRLAVFQHEAKRKGAKSILWSASIEPTSITSEMLDVLNTYDLITARESITYTALKGLNVKPELRLVRDIAFGLPSEPIDLPDEYSKVTFIGINLSPLIARRETIPGIVLDNFRELISHIIAETNMNVALIPHVVMPVDNDYSILTQLLESMSADIRRRVWLVRDKLSAAQYKFIISQCAALICSRTHASIAAYSTGVPCIVVGYSVKSRGIAKDLGKSDFVLPIEHIRTKKDVLAIYRKLVD